MMLETHGCMCYIGSLNQQGIVVTYVSLYYCLLLTSTLEYSSENFEKKLDFEK